MNIRKKLLSFLLFFPASFAFAQSPFPDTDIFIVNLTTEDGAVTCSNPVNITNRQGYDNQPCFSQDGNQILFSSVHEDGQADIYKYDLQSKKTIRVTTTPESEFSPTLMPGGKSFSVVRVEKDSTQRIWSFPLSGGPPKVLLETIDSIGYHCWLGKDTAALFLLTEPVSLQIAADGKDPHITSIVAENIGRCMKKVPGQNTLAFVDKSEGSLWIVKKYDPAKKKFAFLAQCPDKSEDFIWLKDGTLVMGCQGKLMKINPAKESKWTELANFRPLIENIGRLAISPDGKKIALVASPPRPTP